MPWMVCVVALVVCVVALVVCVVALVVCVVALVVCVVALVVCVVALVAGCALVAYVGSGVWLIMHWWLEALCVVFPADHHGKGVQEQEGVSEDYGSSIVAVLDEHIDLVRYELHCQVAELPSEKHCGYVEVWRWVGVEV